MYIIMDLTCFMPRVGKGEYETVVKLFCLGDITLNFVGRILGIIETAGINRNARRISLRKICQPFSCILLSYM